MAGRRKRRRPFPCPQCGGRATWDLDHYRCGRWDPEACQYVDGCGFGCNEEDAPEVDDGRIRSETRDEDVARRIAGARAQREADPAFQGREVLRGLHELYCEAVEREGWVQILAADTWAAPELERRLGRRVH